MTSGSMRSRVLCLAVISVIIVLVSSSDAPAPLNKLNKHECLGAEHKQPLFTPARQGLVEPGGTHYSQRGEEAKAYRDFLNGMVAGSYLEIGALDGVRYSNTLWFHKQLAWHGILIEADPVSYAALVTNRPHDITVHAAVCHEHKTVQYVQSEEPAVSGILEFMTEDFKTAWKSQHEAGKVHQVECLPLRDILARFNIQHIDFFSLDVEGGELQVLQSIDFSKLTVNVFVIEMDGMDPKKDEEIRQLLQHAGYRLHSNDGYNDWFVRDGFERRTTISATPWTGQPQGLAAQRVGAPPTNGQGSSQWLTRATLTVQRDVLEA